MINPEQLIATAEVAIRRCTDRIAGRYHLAVRKGVLICVPSDKVLQSDTPVDILTRHQLEHGLTSSEWSRIGKKLFTIQKGLTL